MAVVVRQSGCGLSLDCSLSDVRAGLGLACEPERLRLEAAMGMWIASRWMRVETCKAGDAICFDVDS